jgi:hypothetical protein
MKKLYYLFTQPGILTVWHTALNQNQGNPEPEVPLFTQNCKLHLQSLVMVPMRQNLLNADGVPVVIDYMLYYRGKYGHN